MAEHVLNSIDPRVLGMRLQEARKTIGATQQAVADEMEMSRTTVVAIEKGERRVSAHELLEFSRLYGRPVSDFLNRPVLTDNFVPQFRMSSRESAQQNLEVEAIAATLQRYAEDYLALEDMLKLPLAKAYPAQYDISAVAAEQAAEEIAAAERNRLGLGDGPLANLRRTLESDVGLRIFFFALPSQIGGLFAYQESLGGCIGINANHPVARQNWSLAHEYAHFLAHRFSPEIMILGERARTSMRERFADRFAENFLMPASGINRRFSDVARSKPAGVALADICTLADLYQVSVQALVLRLEELSRLPRGTWDTLSAKRFKPADAQRLLGIPPREAHTGLPARYVYLAGQAYRNDLLSEGQLARFLHTDRVAARQLIHELESKVLHEANGDFQNVVLDLAEPVTGRA